MKPNRFVWAGLALLLANLPALAVERDGDWILNDLPAAHAEAKKTGKPIFVVFRCER